MLKPCSPNSLFLNSSTTKLHQLQPQNISSKSTQTQPNLIQNVPTFFTSLWPRICFCLNVPIWTSCQLWHLCATRVKSPNEDDWKKLIRLSVCLKCTKHFCLTLEADNLHIARWWADAAFAVHPDMKGHTGATMTMGKGAIQAISTKQKINTKSSTEAELVAADDTLSHLIQTKHFLEAQGHPSQQTILCQDNTSAILLERNGRSSAGKSS